SWIALTLLVSCLFLYTGCFFFFFFFSSRRRHTRCLSDWSSDVCSSDLIFLAEAGGDTDTNAAVAGALLGAREGEASIPPRWLEQLGHARGVSALAERLIQAASSKP